MTREEREEHCWEVVTHLRPCSCGATSVKIEPCEIECENCGRFVTSLNWDESAHQWNKDLQEGPAPEVEGWV